MDFQSLYDMRDGLMRGALRVDADIPLDDYRMLRAESLPQEALVFHYHMGRTPRDLLGTGYAGLSLVSDRVVRTLRSSGFTGWTTYPVTVYGKNNETIRGYSGFAVTGRCGAIDWSRGKKVGRPPPVPGGKAHDAWVGMYFDAATWDGHDVFVPEGTTFTIVCEAVKNALEQAMVTNVAFKRLTEFERTWPERNA